MPITAPTDTRTLTKLASTVLDHYHDQVVDNVFGSNAILRSITELEDGKEYWSGGARLGVPVRLAVDATAGSYEGYDAVDTTDQEQVTVGLVRTAEYYGNVSISQRQIDQSAGPEAVTTMVQIAIEGALGSLKDALNKDLWKDGTGNSSKAILGMGAIVPEDSTTGTLLGISRASNTNWRAQSTSNANTVGNLLADTRTLYESCRFGDVMPTIGVGNRTAINSYESRLVGTIQMNPIITEPGPRTGDGGIDFLRYKSARLIPDENYDNTSYTTGSRNVIVFLNPRFLKLYVHPDWEFAPTEMVKPANQTAVVGQIRFHGQLVPLALRYQGVLYNIGT